MAGKKSRRNGNRQAINLITSVDDATFGELLELERQRIVHIILWDESLADAFADIETDPELRTAFDMDLYLSEGVYFELYAASLYPSFDAAPVQGEEAMAGLLLPLVDAGLWMDEIAVDEEDSLVLILSTEDGSQLYLAIGGCLLEEWDELPR